MEKQQTRIFQKHDTEANWEKNGTNFVPGPGEIIIYDKDEEHSAPRIKIGDGGTKVADLGFLGSGEFNGETSLKISDLENDVGYITKTELVYDTIIHSQAEWDEMVASENWNGARNILFKCHIKAHTKAPDTERIYIPSSVVSIDGNGYSLAAPFTYIEAVGANTSLRNCKPLIFGGGTVLSKINGIYDCVIDTYNGTIEECKNIIGCDFICSSVTSIYDITLKDCDTIILDTTSKELFDSLDGWELENCSNVIYEKTKQSEFQNDVNGNIRNGEGTGSIEIGDETNTAMSPNSVAGGKNSVSGIRGYYIKAINFSERKILLDVDVTELRTSPAMPEITTNAILPTVTEDLPYSTGKYIGIINQNHYVFLTTIEAINGNVVTYAGNPYSVGFSSFVSNLTESDEYMFFVPEEPEKGIVCFTECGVAFGDAAKAASFALSVGENSVAYIYGLATGKNTIAGFGSVAEGIDTKALALASHTEGYGTKALSHVQHVQGKYNVVDVNNEFAHIVGNGTSDSNRSNAHTVDWNGNAWYAGTIYNGFTDIYVPFATNPAYYVNHGESGLVFVYENNEDFPGFTKGDKIAISLGSVQYICSINGVWDESDPGNFGRDGQYGIRININDDNEILIPDSSEKYTTYDIVGTKLEGASFYTIEKKKVFNAKDTIVTGIGAPIADEDAVPKRYVDSKKLSEFENDIGLGTGTTGKDGKSAYEYAKEGGYTGTEAEFMEVMAEVPELSKKIDGLPNNETLIDNVAERVPYVKVAEHPTFVNSVDEMTDTSKMYVLKSDGMFYSYKERTTTTEGGTTPNFTNQVPISTDTDGSIFNGTGYKDNVRLSSSGDISGTAQNGSVTTGFIPWKNTDVVRMKGAKWVGMEGNGHFYFTIYNSNKQPYGGVGKGCVQPDTAEGAHVSATYDEATGITTFSIDDPTGNSGTFRINAKTAAFIRINAYGKGEDLIITVNQEITYTTTEGGTETTYTWESTGISYNQPADYEDRVVIAEADIDRLESQSAKLTNRVNKLEESGVSAGGGGDDESCYDVQMNKLYADSIVKENTALNKALETLCNRRDSSTLSRQVINLKNNEKQKLILHLHKRGNDGYDTVNDAYLPTAQNDFSDVRITTDSGETLKYQTVYSGNIDVISDSRLGNSDVSFLSDGNGYIYIQRQGHIVKSTDAGKTWSKISSITQHVNQLSFVCDDGTLFFCTNNHSLLYKSVPPYTTSTQVLDVSENGLYTGNAIRPFQFVQLPTGEMLLGSYQLEFAVRIWKSTDNGDTWTKVYTNTDDKYQHVHRMNVDAYQNPVAIYAGLDRGWGYKTYDEETGTYYNESGCVLKSVDGGSTWINLYEDQRGKPSTVDHGVTYVDPSGYRLLGGETGICGGHSIIRTTDDINFTAVLNADHAVYGPEKLNGYLIAGGCGSNGGKNAVIFMSDDEGLTWKQIYSEEPTLSNDIASAGIKTFLKGTFAGTDYEQLIGHNMITEVDRPSKRIISDDNSWYAEIIVDVPHGTNSITVESGYMCPNLSVINNDTENIGDAVFVMDFNENGKYLKEKVSGEIYKGDHMFRSGGKHLGYIYPDVKSAIDMNAIKLNSPIFDMGIQKRLNLNASNGLTISFWLIYTVNSGLEIIRNGSDVLTFDGVNIRCNNYNLGAIMSVEGGRFAKVDVVIDGANNTIKTYKNGICMYTTSEQAKLNLVTSLLTGEKDYILLKRSSDDGISAIQHFEIRHGVPTDKEVYDSYFSGLTDNY